MFTLKRFLIGIVVLENLWTKNVSRMRLMKWNDQQPAAILERCKRFLFLLILRIYFYDRNAADRGLFFSVWTSTSIN